MLAENQICRKQLKVKKYLAKRAETKIINKGGARHKLKKSWTVPQAMYGGGVEVGPPKMPGVRQPSTFSIKKLCTKRVESEGSRNLKTETKLQISADLIKVRLRSQVTLSASTSL